jgi:hypothetical protein
VPTPSERQPFASEWTVMFVTVDSAGEVRARGFDGVPVETDAEEDRRGGQRPVREVGDGDGCRGGDFGRVAMPDGETGSDVDEGPFVGFVTVFGVRAEDGETGGDGGEPADGDDTEGAV